MDYYPDTQVQQRSSSVKQIASFSNESKYDVQTIPHEQIKKGRLIGQGGFADVYKGKWHAYEIAIKILRQKDLRGSLEKEFFYEASVMSKLSHPGVIHLYGICQKPYGMILEFASRSDLYHLLKDKQQQLPWKPLRWQLAIDIGSGLSYLHDNRILHRDLKSLNILLDDNLRPKITDFGLAMLKRLSRTHRTEKIRGSIPWMAPELFQRNTKLLPSSDIYSYGMVLWEIASRRLPFSELTPQRLQACVLLGEREKIPKGCPHNYAKVIRACWAKSPEERPTAAKAVQTLQKVKPQMAIKPGIVRSSLSSLPHIIELGPALSTFTGRQELLMKLKKVLIENWNSKASLRQCVLTGLGGVGKTELACQFAEIYKSNFSLVCWIPSTSKENSLRELALKIGCSLDTNDSYDLIVKKVCSTLETTHLNKPYLLIFDDFQEVEILPSRNGCVIITSTNQEDWPQSSLIQVPPFSQDEAIQLVQKITSETDIKSIRILVKALGCLPLMLDQACAYIKKRKYTIADYLKNPNIQTLFQTGSGRHKSSLKATWNDTIALLDPLAKKWLQLCAYFCPNKIPREWLDDWGKERAEDIFSTLCDYHLIRPQGSRPFSINHLLQQLLFDPKVYSDAEDFVLQQIYKLYSRPIKDWNQVKHCLNHAQTVLAHGPFESKASKKIYWLGVRPLLFLAKKYAAQGVKFPVVLAEAAIEEPWWSERPEAFIPMVVHLTSLSISEKVHINIYSKLSTKPSLESLRRVYIDSLSNIQLIKKLASIPNRDGFRYEQQFRDRCLLEQLMTLTTKSSSPIRMRIAGSNHLHNLDPKLMDQLLNSKGYIKRSYKGSMHSVTRLKTQTCDLHFKQAPAHPLMEYAIYSLTARVMGVATPTSTLVRLEVDVNDKTLVYPVLVSETIQGKNLKSILSENIHFKPDPVSFSWQTLVAILIRPGDARASNFIVDADKRLVSVDNDVAFVEPLTRKRWYRTVNFCSILYCLKPRSLESSVVEEFLSISPEPILQGWIDELIVQEKKYYALFSGQERTLFYKNFNNFTPSLLLRQGLVTTLYLQFHSLQNYLRHNRGQSINSMDLLRCITTLQGKNLQENSTGKYLFQYYRLAFLKHVSPFLRLKQATSRKQDQSMTTPNVLRVTIGRTPTSAEIESRELFSLEKAREELLAYSILKIGGVRFDTYQKTKRVSVNFRAIQKNHQPDKGRQEIILQGLSMLYASGFVLPQSTSFRNCAAFETFKLQPFLHKNLTYLDLTGSGLSSFPPEVATACPNLEELYLSGSLNLVAFKGGFFSGRLVFPKLKFLHLARCLRLKEVAFVAPCLKTLKLNNNPNLTYLDYKNLSTKLLIGDSPKLHIESIKGLKERGLNGLNLQLLPQDLIAFLAAEKHRWRIDPSQGAYSLMGYLLRSLSVKKFSSNSKLFELNLENSNIDPRAIYLLAETIKVSSSLVSLNLHKTNIGRNVQAVESLISSFSSSRSLTALNLDNNNIIPAAVVAITQALEVNRHLQYLHLSRNRLGSDGAVFLAKGLSVNRHLKSLYIGNNRITQRGIAALSDALTRNVVLTFLDLQGNSIGDKGVAILAKGLEGNSSLRKIKLSSSRIGDGGVAALFQGIKNNTALLELDLGDNEIGPKGAGAIAKAFKNNCHLITLDIQGRGELGTSFGLRNNAIRDWGCARIAEGLIHNRTLTKLNLSGNKITDEGMKSMGQMLRLNTCLTELDIGYNDITDHGAKVLERGMRKNNSLVVLHLEGNRLTKVFQRKIKSVLKKDKSSMSNHKLKFGGVSQPYCLATFEESNVPICSIEPLPDLCLASGYQDSNKIKILDLSTGSCLKKLAGHSKSVYALAVQSNGWLVSGSKDTTIKVWDVKTGSCVRTLRGHTGSVDVIKSLTNHHLASGSEDQTIRIWDVSTGICVKVLLGHSRAVSALGLLSEALLVSGSLDGTVKVWNLKGGTCLKTLTGHEEMVVAIAVLSNGLLATGSADKTIKIWDVSSGKCLKTLIGHEKVVAALIPLPKGRLASGSWDKSIKIWDVSSATCLQTLQGHSGWVWALAMLSDGRLVSGSWDKTIKIWGL